jgi:hypothetical protein
MDKDKKNRSGSISNRHDKNENNTSRGKTQQPGAPAKSNRQTGNHERDDSSGSERNATKKGANSV